MGYNINYTVIDKDKKTEHFRKTACFSHIYSRIDLYEFVYVYVLKDFGDDSYNSLRFSKEEIEKYVFLLNKMGFFVELSECNVDTNTYSPDETPLNSNKGFPCYKFTIDVNKNNSFKILLLLNAIRNLHEEKFPIIVKKFLSFYDKYNFEKPLDIWNLFLMANYGDSSINWDNSNHHIFWGKGFSKAFTDDSYKSIIENDQKCINISVNLTLIPLDTTSRKKIEEGDYEFFINL